MLSEIQEFIIACYAYPALFSIATCWWVLRLFPNLDQMKQGGVVLGISLYGGIALILIYFMVIDKNEQEDEK